MDGRKLLSSKPLNPNPGEVVVQDGSFLMWDGNDWVNVQMGGYDDSYRKDELIDEFEKNPELFNEIMVEMRNRKINNIKNGKY